MEISETHVRRQGWRSKIVDKDGDLQPILHACGQGWICDPFSMLVDKDRFFEPTQPGYELMLLYFRFMDGIYFRLCFKSSLIHNA